MRKAIPALSLLALTVFAGCSGGQLKPTEQLELCQSNSISISGRLKESESSLASTESARAELEGRIADVESKLKSSQEQIDGLARSNKDLSAAILAGKGEQAGKIKDLVGEKDLLGQRVAALQKEKIALERAKKTLQTQLVGKTAESDGWKLALTSATAKSDEERARVKASEEAAAAVHRARLNKTREDMGTLADAVLKEMQGEKAKFVQDGETILLTIQETELFEPQQAKLTEAGAALLERLGRAIGALGPRGLRVEGHGDNSLLKTGLLGGGFANQWDLSAARAAAVARYLHEHGGLDPRRLTASGYGEFRPVAGHDTAPGREANKRVVLVVEPGS